MKYDFHGWATKNDLRCSDGRTIRHNAFKECDGKIVPLVWQHQHDDPSNVLGHALLENRDEGVYVYGSFNNSTKAADAKEAISHGDIVALSIYANNLQQRGGDVLHGVIREVSLVLAGANPGAFIEFPRLAHSDDFVEDEATIFSGELLHAESGESDHEEKEEEKEKELEHADEKGDRTVKDVLDAMSEKKRNVVMYLIGEALADKDDSGEVEHSGMNDKESDGETVKDILDSMTDEERDVTAYLIGEALEKAGKTGDEATHSDINEEDDEMKENIFDKDTAKQNNYISHADQEGIISVAKKTGSFRQVLEAYMEENELQHDAVTAPVSGFAPDNIGQLFPEYRDVRPGAPELVTDDLGWVEAILRKVHKSPFSRIRTSQVDIRNLNDLRARGYKKGTKKNMVGNYQVARRTTDPQTIYVKSALNRDDIIDITDFDYVDYQYKIDQMQLREELATAMLLSDGRSDDAEGKIETTHIRPVYGDDSLFTIYKDIKPFLENINGEFSNNFGENYKYSEGVIAALLDAKIDFRGTGSSDLFCTQRFFNKMLLAKDLNGRRIYANKQELATALGVNEIYPVSKMEGKTRTVIVDGVAHTMQLDAIVVNWADYSLGSTKGGQITHFTQFDIDFNQEKSLLETRVSGANTRIYSAIVLEEDTTVTTTPDEGEGGEGGGN